MSHPFTIHIDHREKSSHLPEFLAGCNADLIFSTLEVGDYLVNDTILIERKTVFDFMQSLKQGRLFAQCRRMKQTNKKCLFIIEGDFAESFHNISIESLRGVFLSMMIPWQIPLYFTKDKSETADVIVSIGNQELKKEASQISMPVNRTKSYGSQVYFLQALPFIGPKNSHALLKRFHTVSAIATAKVDDLISVEGIGTKKAKRIRDFFNRQCFS
jgi:DNA excision repair protein ERCC-4